MCVINTLYKCKNKKYLFWKSWYVIFKICLCERMGKCIRISHSVLLLVDIRPFNMLKTRLVSQ